MGHRATTGHPRVTVTVLDPGCYVCEGSGLLLRCPTAISFVGERPFVARRISYNPYLPLTDTPLVNGTATAGQNTGSRRKKRAPKPTAARTAAGRRGTGARTAAGAARGKPSRHNAKARRQGA